MTGARRSRWPAVYPRVGGGNEDPLLSDDPDGGLSPRGRGKQRPADLDIAAAIGSIPAWAGETFAQPKTQAVYNGLSPRGRGKPPAKTVIRRSPRSIPAWAGETFGAASALAWARVYPRVGGGNCAPGRCRCRTGGLSPRGRGKPWRTGLSPCNTWSIPAWAGETEIMQANGRGGGVYPRVGGGNPGGGCMRSNSGGLSPRGRGKPGYKAVGRSFLRSIPAWAGETRA